jgi:hypothetical protein
MTGITRLPPAPEGQQGPPTRAAASDSWRSLRDARGSLPLTSGTASHHRHINRQAARDRRVPRATPKLDENRKH